MSFYECVDYKEALKVLTEDRKTKRKSITYEAMAAHCNIQKTYLSKVLNKDGNLSLDQLFLAADYLKLTAFENQFIENLYLWNTTTVAARKSKYLQALEKARREILKSENSLKTETESLQNLMLEKYYLDPSYQLIHIFLTIPEYSKNFARIAEKLNLPKEIFENYLQDLTDWKIIEFKSNSYQVIRNNLHLPKDSDLTATFRNSTRLASQNKMNLSKADDFYSFFAIISCDEETKQRIQKRFLDFLKQCQNDVMKSDSEEVFQINFDLLKN